MKGSGALYIRQGLKIRPLVYGGNQESGMRSGTEGMPQIAAFAAAAAYRKEHMAENTEHMAALKAALIERIRELGGTINTPERSADHIVNFSMCRGRSEVYIRILSDMGVYVSGGSACSRGKSSHVLEAMRLPKKNIDAALRVNDTTNSTGVDNVYAGGVAGINNGAIIINSKVTTRHSIICQNANIYAGSIAAQMRRTGSEGAQQIQV